VSTVGFTPEKEKKLTALDAAAHDLLRVENDRQGKIAPCWLVCSEDTRAEYRQKAVDFANKHSVLPVFSVEYAPKQFERMISRHFIERWRAAELEAKKGREAHDPRSFFT
jgi:hypothetical protein